MPERTRRKWPVLMSVAFGGAALLVVIGIVISPGEAFRASLSGLQIWWQQVFPGLVPPLILAELLAASGLLHALAALAEPLTRRWFRLPGAAGWAIAFGWSAGVPAGAKETARLRESGLIRDAHTNTLLLLSHVPNPFLVVVVVGSGLLQSAALGWAMAAGLWLSALCTGFLWSRLEPTGNKQALPTALQFPGSRLGAALRAAAQARRDDGRPLGKQLADAVTHAVSTLMTIGGLMMMASVVLHLLQRTFPGTDTWLAVPGLYEMHLGAYESGRSPLFESAPAQAASLLAAALAWTGWSGLLQARAVFGPATLFPWGRLIAGKLLHAALAMAFTYPLANALAAADALPSLLPRGPYASDTVAAQGAFLPGWRQWPEIWVAGLSSLAVFLLLALLAAVIRPKPPRRDADAPPPPAR
jgi:sporulation integral membrane protein YlbJ